MTRTARTATSVLLTAGAAAFIGFGGLAHADVVDGVGTALDPAELSTQAGAEAKGLLDSADQAAEELEVAGLPLRPSGLAELSEVAAVPQTTNVNTPASELTAAAHQPTAEGLALTGDATRTVVPEGLSVGLPTGHDLGDITDELTADTGVVRQSHGVAPELETADLLTELGAQEILDGVGLRESGASLSVTPGGLPAEDAVGGIVPQSHHAQPLPEGVETVPADADPLGALGLGADPLFTALGLANPVTEAEALFAGVPTGAEETVTEAEAAVEETATEVEALRSATTVPVELPEAPEAELPEVALPELPTDATAELDALTGEAEELVRETGLSELDELDAVV